MHPIERLRYVARAGDVDPSLLAEEAALALGALAAEPRALVPAARRLLEFHPSCAPLWWVCAELLSADRPAARAEELAAALNEDPTADELAAALPGAATLVTTGGAIIDSALRERPDLTVHLVGTAASLRYQLRRIGDTVEVEGFLGHEIAEALDGAGAVVVEAAAVAPDGALFDPLAAALAGAAGELELWVVAGCGRLLPAALFAALRAGTGQPQRARPSRGSALPVGGPDEDLDAEGPTPEFALVALDGRAVIAGPEGPLRLRDAAARARCPVPPELLATVRE